MAWQCLGFAVAGTTVTSFGPLAPIAGSFMTTRYVCIHGHFYQPPRENAWLEAVEQQESAYPDHDWNERITRECYGRNASARLLDEKGRITRITNNYSRISFNFGPTLLAWMKANALRDYDAVIEADRRSVERYGGHGSAMAQGYNHAILPLCNDRDRRTQVRWGVRDFEFRYGRRPEGMWLPETAADMRSLEALAEHGIKFTVLAPRQCAAVRPTGTSTWSEVGESVDPSRAYRCELPSGKTMALFFYDGPVSQAVAFEGLLNSGDRFAERLLGGVDPARGHAQLIHIATDGESYGHHHRHGEMALCAALERIDRTEGIGLINYAQFLERHPPELEARIHENSSWSCVHGVERWKSDCGCNSGRQSVHQKWRAPLRAAFDWLRDAVNPVFEDRARSLFADPWAARDAYIDVILDRSTENVDRFLNGQASRALDQAERTRAMCLMELQRHALLLYTSCAWFFDDIGGIETVQVIQYAARVVQLARENLGIDLEPGLLERLALCRGNSADMPDGRAVYEKSVRPAMIDPRRVGAHYAVSQMFDSRENRVHAFEVSQGPERRRRAGRARLLLGRAVIRSRITLDHHDLSYCVPHLGDHTVSCGVRAFRGDDAFDAMVREVEATFDKADFTGVLRMLDSHFDGTAYSIGSLFRDQQRAVVRRILEPALAQVDAAYAHIYEQNAPIARFLRSLGLEVPHRIQIVGTFVLSQALSRALEKEPPDLLRAAEIAAEAAREGIALDEPTVSIAAHEALRRGATLPGPAAEDPGQIEQLLGLSRFIKSLPFSVDLWVAQEAFFERVIPRRVDQAALATDGDERARRWLGLQAELGEAIDIAM